MLYYFYEWEISCPSLSHLPCPYLRTKDLGQDTKTLIYLRNVLSIFFTALVFSFCYLSEIANVYLPLFTWIQVNHGLVCLFS